MLDPSGAAIAGASVGGSVKNIALASAFLAAEEKAKVRTAHVLKATRREFQKMGKMRARR